MRVALLTGALAICSLASAANAGGIVEGAELEHARANARAGGPVSEQDVELLERYGCSSGTRSAFCRHQSSGYRYYQPRHHRRHRR